MRVRQLMTTDVVTVGPDASLKEVASLLARHRISGLPVVDSDGRVLGVVSETDIVQKEAQEPQPASGLLRWLDPDSGRLSAKLAAHTAGEAMSSPAVTIEANLPVSAAASLMLDNGCKRLPVTDGGKLAGVVSRADLVRAFARSDVEIEREINEDVVLRTFAIAPETLRVEVAHGDVRLGGEVETPELAKLLAEFVARVPGVVSVDSNLSSRTGGVRG
jgi:CBS domain-containing protein